MIWLLKSGGTTGYETVLNFTPTSGGTLINGGAFGLEGGLAVTIVLVVATTLMLLIRGKRDTKSPADLGPTSTNYVA